MEFRAESLRGQRPKNWSDRIKEANLSEAELYPDNDSSTRDQAIFWSKESGTAMNTETGQVFICGTVALDPLEVTEN